MVGADIALYFRNLYLDKKSNQPKKALAIGNSFSQDAMAFLHKIAVSANVNLDTVNLYVPGCSLEAHSTNIDLDAKAYQKFVNTEDCGLTSIKDALISDKWDVVTIQQVSHLSGVNEKYEPFGTNVINCVKEYSPNSKIFFHKTWAYEIDHNFTPNYENQTDMYNKLCVATSEFCAKHNLPYIPAGEVIQALRMQPEFDYANGGKTLCRDGFHLNVYGLYAAGATWFEILTKKSILKTTFTPPEIEENLVEIIKKTVHSVCEKYI